MPRAPLALCLLFACGYDEDAYVVEVVDTWCEASAACGSGSTKEECIADLEAEVDGDWSSHLYCPEGVAYDPGDAKTCAAAIEVEAEEIIASNDCESALNPVECDGVCVPDLG